MAKTLFALSALLLSLKRTVYWAKYHCLQLFTLFYRSTHLAEQCLVAPLLFYFSLQLFMFTNFTNPFSYPGVIGGRTCHSAQKFMGSNTILPLPTNYYFVFLSNSLNVYVLSLMWLLLKCTEYKNTFKSKSNRAVIAEQSRAPIKL